MLFNTCTDILRNTLLLPAASRSPCRLCSGAEGRQRGSEEGAHNAGFWWVPVLARCSRAHAEPDQPWVVSAANSQLKKDHALKGGTERHQCTTQHTLAEIRWIKACEPLCFHCHCFTSPLWSQADVARSEVGSVTLALRLLQLTRAHCTF